MARAAQPHIVYLDTHVLMWLYDGLTERLSMAATEAVERGRLFVSPMAELELQYVHEIGRFRPTSDRAIATLADEIGLQRAEFSFRQIVARARALSWTRDPFDRLLVAETILAGAMLVTKDSTIRKNFAGAVW